MKQTVTDHAEQMGLMAQRLTRFAVEVDYWGTYDALKEAAQRLAMGGDPDPQQSLVPERVGFLMLSRTIAESMTRLDLLHERIAFECALHDIARKHPAWDAKYISPLWGVFEYEAEEVKAMMGPGEDSEEFALRLCHEAMKHNETQARFWSNMLQVARSGVLHRQITREQYDAQLEEITQNLLEITGPVEPSTEYIGYL